MKKKIKKKNKLHGRVKFQIKMHYGKVIQEMKKFLKLFITSC